MRFFFLTAVVVTLFPGLLGQGFSNNGKGLGRGRRKNSLAADLFGLATNPMSMFNGLTGGITLGGTNELDSGNIGSLLSLGGSGSNSVSGQSNGNRPSETLVTTITTTIRSWPVGVVPGMEEIIKPDGSVVWMITTISSQGVPGARLVRKPDGSFWYLLTVTSTQKPQLNLPVLLTLREIIRPNGQIQYIPYSKPKVMGTMIGYHKIIRLDGSVVYYITRRANPGQRGARKVRQPNGSIWWLITIITSEKPNDLPEGEPMLEIPGPNGQTQYVPYGPIQSGPNPNEQQPIPIGTRPEVQPVIKPDGSIMYFMTNIAQPGQPGAIQVRKPDGTYWWLITVSSPYKPTGTLPVADPVKEVQGPNGQPLYIPIGPNPSGQNPNGQNPNDQSPVPIGTKPEVQPVIKPDGSIMYFMTNIAQPGQPGAIQVRKPDGTYWWLITVSSPYKPTGTLPVADPVKEVQGPNGQPLYIPIGPNPSGQNPNGQNPNDQSPVPIGTKPEVQPVIKPDGSIMYFMTNIAQPGQPGAIQVRKPDGTYWWLITVSSPYKPTGTLPVADPVKEVQGPNGQPLYIPIGPNPSGQNPNGQNPNDQSPVPIGTKPEVQPVIKPDGSIMYFMTNIAQPGQPGAIQVRKPDGTYWWLITVSSPYKPTGTLPVADPVKEVEGPNGQPLYIPIGPNPSGQNPNGQNPNDQSPVPIGTKPEVQPVIKPDGSIMYFMTNIAQPGQPGAKQVRKPDGTYWWLITVSSPYKPTGTLPVADPVKEVQGPNGQPLYIPIGPNPSGQNPNGQNPNDQSPVPIGTKPEVQPVIKPDGSIMYFMTNIAQPGQPGAKQVRKPDGTYWWLITVSSPYKPTGTLPVADPVKEVQGPNGQPLYIPIGPNPSGQNPNGQNPNDQSPVPIGTKPEVQPVIKPDGSIMYFMTNIAQPGQPGAKQVRKPDGTYWWLITVSSPYKPTGTLPVADPVKEVQGPNGQPLYIPIGPNPSGQNPNGQNPNDQSPVPIGTKPEVQPVIKPDGSIMYFMTNIAQPGQPGAKQVRKPDGTYWWLITVSSPYKPTGTLPVADPVKEVQGPDGQPQYIPVGQNPSGQIPTGQPGQQPSGQPGQPGQQPNGQPPSGQPGQPGQQQPGQQPNVQYPYGQQPSGQPGQQPNGATPSGQPEQPGQQQPGQQPNVQYPYGQQPSGQPGQQPNGATPSGQPEQPGQQQPGQQPNVQYPYGQQPSGQPGQQPNGATPSGQPEQPGQQQPGQQPNVQYPYGQQPSGQPGQPGQQPNGQPPSGQPGQQQPGQQPSGQPGQQPNGATPSGQPEQPGQQQPGQQPNVQYPYGQQPSGQPGQQPNGQPPSGQPGQPGQQQPGQQPSGQPGQQPNGATPSEQPEQPGQQQPGQQPNVQYPYGQQPSGQPGQQPNGQPPSGQPGQPGQQQPGQQPSGQPGQQPNGATPSGQPEQPGQQQPGQQPNVQYPYGQQPSGQPGQQPNGQPPSGQPGQPGQQQPGQQPSGQPGQQPNGATPSGQPEQPGQQQPGQQPGEPQYIPSGQVPTKPQPTGQQTKPIGNKPGVQPVIKPDGSIVYMITTPASPNQPDAKPVQQPDGSVLYYITIISQQKPQGNLPVEKPVKEVIGPNGEPQYIPSGQVPTKPQPKPIGNKPGVQPVIKPDGSIVYMITTPASPNQPDAKPVQQPDGSVLYYITIISQQKPQGNLPVEEPVKEVMGPNGEPQYIPSGQVPTKPQPKPIGNKPGVQPVIKPDGSIVYMITTPASPNQPDAKPVQQPDGSVLYYITIISQQKPQGNLPVEKPVKEVIGPNGEPQYIPSGQVPTKPQPTGQQTKPIGNKPGVQPVIKPDGSIVYMITTPASPNQPDAKPVQQPDGSVLYYITIISQQKPQGNLPVEEPVKEVMGPNGEPQYIPSGQVPTKPQPTGQQTKPIGNKPGVQPVIKPDGSIVYMITTPASPNQPDAKPVQQPDGSVLYYITIISQQKPQGNLPVEKPVKEVIGPNGEPQYIPSGQVPTKPQPKPIGNKPGVQPVIKPDGSIVYMITTPASPNQPDAKPVQQPDGSVLYYITIISQQKPQGNLPVEKPVKEVIGPNGEPQYIPSGQVPTKPQPTGQQTKPIGNKPGVQPVIKPDGSIVYMITTPASPNQPDAKPVQQPDGSVLYYITIISQQKPQGNLPVEKPVKEVIGPNGEPQYIPSGQVPTKPQPKPIGNKPGVQPVIKPDGSIVYMITTPASPNQPDAKPVQQPDGSVLYYITIISQQKPQGNLPVEEPVKEVMGPNGEPQYIPSGQVPTKPQPKPIGNKPGVQPVIKPDGSIVYMITTPASPNQPDAKPVQQPDGSVLYYITIISQQKPQGNLPVEKPVKEVIGPNGEPQYIPSGQVPTKPQPTGQQTKPIGNKPGVQPVIKPDGSIVYMITTPASPNQPDAKPVQQPDGSVLYYITIISQQKPQGNLPVEKPVKEVIGPNGEPQYIPSGQVPTKPQPTGQQTKPIGNKPGVQPVIKPDGSIVYMITTPASPNQPDAKPVQQPDGSVLYYITIISQQKPQGNLPVEEPVKEVMGPNGEPQYIPSGQVPTKPQPTGQQTKPIGNKPGVQPVIKPDGSIVYMITTPASPNQPDAKPVQQPDGSVLYYITIISQQKPQGNLPVEKPVKEVIGPNGEPQYIPSGQVPTKPQPTGQQTKPIGNKPGVQPVIKPDGSIVYMITTPASPNQPDAKPVQQPDGSVLYYITIISQQKPQGNLPVEKPVKEVIGPNGEPQYIPSGQVPTKPQPKPIGNKPGVQPVIKPDGSIVYMITTPASPNQPDAKPVQQPDGSVLYYITIISQQKPQGNLPVEKPVKEVIGPNGEPQYIPSGQVPTKPQPKPIGNKPGVQPVIKPDGSIVYMITTPASPNQPDAKPVQQPDGSVLYYITIISQQKPQGNLPVEEPVKEVMGPNGEPQYIPSGQVPTKPQPTGQQTKPIGNKPGVQPVIKPDGSIVYMITTPASPNQPGAKPIQQPDGSVLYYITIISQQKPQGNLPVEEPVKEVMGPNGEPQYIPSGQVPTKPQPGGQQPKPIGNKPSVQPVIKPDGSIVYMITTPASPNQPDAKPVQQPDGSVLYYITIISQQKPQGNLPVEKPVKEVIGPNGEPQYIPSGQVPTKPQPTGQQTKPIGNKPGVQPVIKPDGSIVYMITTPASPNQPDAKPVQQPDGSVLYYITIISQQKPQGNLPVEKPVKEVIGPNGEPQYIPSGQVPTKPQPTGQQTKPIGNKPGVQPVIKPDGSIVYMITTPASPNQPDAKPVQQPDGSVLYYITIISQQKPQGNLPVEEPVKEVMGPNGEPQYIPSGQVPTKPQPTGQQTKPIGNKPGVQPVIKPDGSIVYMITTPASPNQPDAKPVQQPDGSVLYYITIISQQKPLTNLPVEEPVKEVIGPNGEPQYIPSGQVPTKPQPKPIGNKPGVQPVIKPDGSIVYMITTPASPNQPGATPVQQPDGSVLYFITIISQQKPLTNLPVEEPVKEVIGPNGEPQYIPSGQVPTKPQPAGQQTKPIGNKPGVQPVIKPDGSIVYMITTPASPNQPGATPVQQPDGSVLYFITIISQQKPLTNLPVEEPVKEVMDANGKPQYIPIGQPQGQQPNDQLPQPINTPGVQKVVKPDGSVLYVITRECSENTPGARPVQTEDGHTIYIITITSDEEPEDYEPPSVGGSIEYTITTTGGQVSLNGNKPGSIPAGAQQIVGPDGKITYVFSGNMPMNGNPSPMEALQSLIGSLPQDISKLITQGDFAGALSKLHQMGMDTSTEIAPGLTIESVLKNLNGSGNNVTIQGGVHVIGGSSESNQIGDNGLSSGSLSPNGNVVYSFGGSNGGQSNSFSLPNSTVQTMAWYD